MLYSPWEQLAQDPKVMIISLSFFATLSRFLYQPAQASRTQQRRTLSLKGGCLYRLQETAREDPASAGPPRAGAAQRRAAPNPFIYCGSGGAGPNPSVQAEYYVPLKPQGEFGQADCNYLAWHRPRTPALAPFQNGLLTKAMQKRGPESGGQDLAVVPLMKDTTSVSPALCPSAAPALSQGTSAAPRATRATTAAPSVPQNSPRRAVAKPHSVTGGCSAIPWG